MIPYVKPCDHFQLAHDGSGKCSTCRLARAFHHDACPACHRKGMKGRRHKASPGGSWCDGRHNMLRDRAHSALLGARDEACEGGKETLARYRHAADLCMGGKYALVLTFLQSDSAPPPAPRLLHQAAAPARKRGQLIKFNPG